MGLTKPEIDDLLAKNSQSAYIPPYELSKRFEQFYDVIKMVYADGVIDDNEMKLASRLAMKSGFGAEDIPLLLAVLVDGLKKGDDPEDLFAIYKKRRMAR